MTTSTRAISKTLLEKETDARFWAQTGYKVGRKLDLVDPVDRAMAKIWVDIFAKVKREDAAGALVVTYNHPVVERALDHAATAASAVEGHLDAAVQAPDAATTQQHVDRAADAARVSADLARQAAQVQPPTVSPIVVQAAAQDAAVAVSAPPPPPVVQNLPPHHPAVRSIRARPILTPDIVQAATRPPASAADPMPAEVVLDPQGGPVTTIDHATVVDPGALGHPAYPSYATSAPPPTGATNDGRDHGAAQARHRHHRHQFSAAQASAAPATAVEVHADAHARDAQGAPPPVGTLHPQTVAQIRDVAAELARRAPAPIVGVAYGADEQWAIVNFQTADEAATWYDQTHDHLDTFRYIAYFDKASPQWPASVNEVLGSSKSLEVRERVTKFAREHKFPLAVVGAALAIGAAVAVAGARKRSPGSRTRYVVPVGAIGPAVSAIPSSSPRASRRRP